MKAVLAKDKLEMMIYTGLKLNENELNRKPNNDETKELNDIFYEFIGWIRSNEEEEEIEFKQPFPKLQSEATVDDEKREYDDDFNEEIL